MIKKNLCLFLYYGFARYLPSSSTCSIAKKIRYILCKNIFRSCGIGVNVERGAWFGTGRNLEIGDFSGIGKNCRIYNNTKIGSHVMMGPKCYFLESTHLFESTEIPMRNQGRVSSRAQVVIEDDVWIGREVMVIGSKTIRKGTILGARTVLTKEFPEYSIVGGNPSRLIRSRKQD